MPGIVDALAKSLEASGGDLTALGLGWARAAPVVAIVPAFGLRAVPGAVRALLGLALAASIAPAVSGDPALLRDGWVIALLTSAARGIPIALAAAIPLWAATTAGGVIDAVRGANDTVQAPTVEGRPSPLGVPMALLASLAFLGSGGPARVAAALADSATHSHPIARAAFDISSGIQIAVAVAAPVLAASVVVEISTALIARAASPSQVQSLLSPLRSIAILMVAALTFERMVAFTTTWAASRP